MIHSILQLLKNPFTLVFAAVTVGYGLYNRWLLLQVYGPSFKTGFWEMVTTVTTDPQYIAFVILPAWLILSVSKARRESAAPRLLRHGSRMRAWAHGWRNAWGSYLALAIVVLAAVGLSSFGLPLRAAPEPGSSETIFASHGLLPLAGLLLQVLLAGATLTTISATFNAVALSNQRQWINSLLAIATGVWVAASSVGLIHSDSILNASRFLDVGAFLLHPHQGAVAVVTLVCAASIAWLCVVYADRRVVSGRMTWQPFIFYLLGVGVFTIGTQISLQDSRITFFDATTQTLYGAGWLPLPFLTSTYITAGFAVVVLLELRLLEQGWMQVELLRYGSFLRWFGRFAGTNALRAVLVLASVAVACMAGFLVAGGSNFSWPAAGLALWLTQLTLNLPLQLFCYALLCSAVVIVFRTSSAALAIVLVILAGSFFDGRLAPWNPFGAGSMGRVDQSWLGVGAASAGLVAASFLVLFLLARLDRARRLTF